MISGDQPSPFGTNNYTMARATEILFWFPYSDVWCAALDLYLHDCVHNLFKVAGEYICWQKCCGRRGIKRPNKSPFKRQRFVRKVRCQELHHKTEEPIRSLYANADLVAWVYQRKSTSKWWSKWQLCCVRNCIHHCWQCWFARLRAKCQLIEETCERGWNKAPAQVQCQGKNNQWFK